MKKKGVNKISPKSGRPKSSNPKKYRFELRLTEGEVSVLEECSEKLQISKADVVLKGIDLVKEKIDKNKK